MEVVLADDKRSPPILLQYLDEPSCTNLVVAGEAYKTLPTPAGPPPAWERQPRTAGASSVSVVSPSCKI